MTTTNRYNAQAQIVRADPVYKITPEQARMVEQATQPILIPGAPLGQTSATEIDVSKVFEPMSVKEQFKPKERAIGFMLMAALFVGAALIFALASMFFLALPVADTGLLFAILMMATLFFLFAKEKEHSAAGLAIKHQDAAKDALQTIVASNETVSLAKLGNEDRAHEREIALRSKVLDGYLGKLEVNRHD